MNDIRQTAGQLQSLSLELTRTSDESTHRAFMEVTRKISQNLILALYIQNT